MSIAEDMRTTEGPAPRAAVLRAATGPTHERLDKRIMEHQPFSSVERYAAFVRAQHAFQSRVDALHAIEQLHDFVPDLKSRARLAAVEADLRDIGSDVPTTPETKAPANVGEALGWLYVSEGSTLGAAFLLKEVQKLGLDADNGARHMAPHADGRGLNWRRFTERLNAAELSEAEEASVVSGANEAFAFVRDAFEREFARVGAPQARA